MMKMKIYVVVVCLVMCVAGEGVGQSPKRDAVIRIQDNRRPVKKVEKRVYKTYNSYPYYSYPWWGWGPYYPWGAPYYGPGYYGPGFGVYVGF